MTNSHPSNATMDLPSTSRAGFWSFGVGTVGCMLAVCALVFELLAWYALLASRVPQPYDRLDLMVVIIAGTIAFYCTGGLALLVTIIGLFYRSGRGWAFVAACLILIMAGLTLAFPR